MYIAKYLLSIKDLLDADLVEEDLLRESLIKKRQTVPKVKCNEALLKRVLFRVDDIRREKAQGMRQEKTRAACLGAGLLLQLAVWEALHNCGESSAINDSDETIIKRYSVKSLLAYLEDKPQITLSYRYGKRGKPYFTEFPYYFNLSHSGDYVLCGLSESEIGADIQQHRESDQKRLARRFFSKREISALEAVGEDEVLFFRLWARKEAYGKLTGEGVAGVLEMDLLPQTRTLPESGYYHSETSWLPDGRSLIWEECDVLAGYSIAFCQYE